MVCASARASKLKGIWTGIWSPSKSAWKPSQTSGCNIMAFPSTKTGSNAWIPNLWSVGARLRITGCPLIALSNISQTIGLVALITRLALARFDAWLYLISSFITKGLNNSRAISFGSPHWLILSSGPTTITERPE